MFEAVLKYIYIKQLPKDLNVIALDFITAADLYNMQHLVDAVELQLCDNVCDDASSGRPQGARLQLHKRKLLASCEDESVAVVEAAQFKDIFKEVYKN